MNVEIDSAAGILNLLTLLTSDLLNCHSMLALSQPLSKEVDVALMKEEKLTAVRNALFGSGCKPIRTQANEFKILEEAWL